MGEERIIPPPPQPLHRESDILEEVPEAAAVVLWQDVRHLRDWAETDQGARGNLFREVSLSVLAKRREARLYDGVLAGPLGVFAAMKATPLGAEPTQLGAACESIAEWATGREYMRTAIVFAETAALVNPTNPKTCEPCRADNPGG